MVDKITGPITPLGEINKINEIIDNLGGGNFHGTSFYSTNGENIGITRDCNGLTANGHYYYSTNGPSGLGEQSTDGAVFVQGYNDNWVTQIAQDYRTGNLFIRSKNNGTWTAWKAIANKSDIPDISGKENTSNKVTSLSSSSTNTQYPSAKCVYDALQNVGSSSSRNIGEIVASTIPLTDAGLHLLDGALISGSGSYSDFVSYIGDLYNTTAKTYKPSAFTVVGNPTISADGILTGTANAYLTSTISGLSSATNYTIKVEYTPSRVDTWGWIIYPDNHTGLGLLQESGIVHLCDVANTTSFTRIANANLTLNTKTIFEITVDGTSYNFKVTINGVEQSSSGTFANAFTGNILWIGNYPAAPAEGYAKGSIDLKEFSITVDGTQVLSGSDRTGFCLESEWQQSYTDYGVCGKFVYESVNNTVRLPKYNSKIYTGGGTAHVVGNGTTLGLTNGTTNFGLGIYSLQSLGGSTLNYNTNVGTAVGTGANYSPLSLGVVTDGSKSGLIAQLSDITTSLDGYYYIVVATSTKTDIEVDIDEIATDLNGKADKDLSNVPNSKGILTESYVNGTSWYRIYSDGWCEQGGYIKPVSTSYASIPLLKTYKDANYSLQLSQCNYSGQDANYSYIVSGNRTNALFQIIASAASSSCSWQACGYIS